MASRDPLSNDQQFPPPPVGDYMNARLSRAQWDAIEEAIERFEVAWHADAEPELAVFLDDFGPAIRTNVLVELIKIDIEYRWKLGKPRYVDEYLGRWPQLRELSGSMAELIESECIARAQFATIPEADELIDRYGEVGQGVDLSSIAAEVQLDRPTVAGDASTTPPESTVQTTRTSPPVFLPKLAGQTFDRYEICEQLGDGGEAHVYRAFDLRLQRDVAIKFPRYSDPKVLERFTREPEAASAVEDRHICRIYDAGTINGVHYITMQYVEGTTLLEHINENGPLEPQQSAEIVGKVAEALGKVHQAGVIHRDIKPSNIMIDLEQEPVLMDFGLARPIEAATGMTTTGAFVGTIAYMAPEQARGEPADARSDIYGLGVVLYQLLTGRVPFSESPTDCLAQKQKHPLPSPADHRPDLNVDIDGICRKAMAIAPEIRYQSASELADACHRYVEGRPQMFKPPKRKATARSRTLIAAAAVMLLAIVGGALWLNLGSGDGFATIPEPRAGTVDRWIETPRPDGEANAGVIAIHSSMDGERLFIAHSQHTGTDKGGPVRAIDVITGEDAVDPVPFEPFHLHDDFAVTADERSLFVPNYYFSYITRIDLDGDNKLTDIPVTEESKGGHWWAKQLDWTPDRQKLVVLTGADGRLAEPNSQTNNGVSILDASDDEYSLITWIGLEDEPGPATDLVITADGRFAYFVTQPHPPNRSPRLYRVELQEPYEFKSLPFPDDSKLETVVLSDKLGQLFVSDSAQRKIWKIDVDSFPNQRSLEFFHLNGRAPTTLLYDDTRDQLVALSSEWRTLCFLDARDGSILGVTEGLRDSCGRLAFTADRKSVLVASSAPRGGIAVVSVPDDRPKILFTSDRDGATFQLYTMNTDGTGVQPFFPEPRMATDRMPRWSPDGSQIAFLSNEMGTWHIHIADRSGTNVRALSETAPDVGTPIDWSPDGNRVAFIHQDKRAIHAVDVETGVVEVVQANFPDGYNRPNYPCWGRDGYIYAGALPSNWGPDEDIFRIAPDSGTTVRLTNENGADQHCEFPIVSREGRLACLRKFIRDDPHAQLYVAPDTYTLPDSMQPNSWVSATNGKFNKAHAWPRWFPDGQQIVYTDFSTDGYYEHIFVVDIETHEVRQLTHGEWNCTQPDVSPRQAE